ncbi:MAG TPA: TonB-dependent receptor, partial [Campylobacterales bacterium]|nr:TonB-dependent receptor [Campylobacterales bacterium]
SDYRTRYVNGKFQYFIDDTSDLTFGFEKSYREKDSHGTVGGITQAKNDPESASTGATGAGRDYTRMYNVDLLKLYATYAKDFASKGNLMVNGYYYGDKTNFLSAPQNFTSTGVAVTSEDAYTTKNDYSQAQRGIKSEFRKSGDALAYMLGLDVRNNNYKNITSYITDFKTSAFSPTNRAGTITGNDKTTEEVYAPYVEAKYAVSNKLTITLNGRYDDVRYKYEDYKNSQTLKSDFEVWSQRIGLAYQAAPYATIFFNRSTGFRTPSVTQLYAGSTSLDGKTENNPNLKPEQSVNYDIGARGDVQMAGNKSSYELAFFWLDRKNYISSILGDYAAAMTTNHQRYENVGGMRSKGIELSVNTDNKKPIWIEAAYTYLDAKFTGSDSFYLGLGNQYVPAQYSQVKYDLRGKTVPRTSRDTFDITLSGRPTPTTIVSLEYLNKSGYFADEINQLKMEGYDVFNLIVRHSKKIGKFTVEAFARVDNLCDRRYIANARASSDRDSNKVYDYEDFTATVNPGRVWTAGMSMKF